MSVTEKFKYSAFDEDWIPPVKVIVTYMKRDNPQVLQEIFDWKDYVKRMKDFFRVFALTRITRKEIEDCRIGNHYGKAMKRHLQDVKNDAKFWSGGYHNPKSVPKNWV